MADPELITRLAQHRTLGSAPRAELEWVVAHATRFRLEQGNLLDRVSDLIDQLSIILSGHFAIYVNHGAGPHKVMQWQGGDVSGFLPYSLVAGVRWVGAGCTTRALAAEVERAATRIHDLVAAIKRFTYMDKASAPEPVDLVPSLNDSVALLLHKAPKKNVSLSISVDPDLPKVLVMAAT